MIYLYIENLSGYDERTQAQYRNAFSLLSVNTDNKYLNAILNWMSDYILHANWRCI